MRGHGFLRMVSLLGDLWQRLTRKKQTLPSTAKGSRQRMFAATRLQRDVRRQNSWVRGWRRQLRRLGQVGSDREWTGRGIRNLSYNSMVGLVRMFRWARKKIRFFVQTTDIIKIGLKKVGARASRSSRRFLFKVRVYHKRWKSLAWSRWHLYN